MPTHSGSNRGFSQAAGVSGSQSVGLLVTRSLPLAYVSLKRPTDLFTLVVAYPAFYDSSPLDVSGIIFMLVTGLICFVPLALFARGIVRSGHSSSPA
jgi:hypothetical protein